MAKMIEGQMSLFDGWLNISLEKKEDKKEGKKENKKAPVLIKKEAVVKKPEKKAEVKKEKATPPQVPEYLNGLSALMNDAVSLTKLSNYLHVEPVICINFSYLVYFSPSTSWNGNEILKETSRTDAFLQFEEDKSDSHTNFCRFTTNLHYADENANVWYAPLTMSTHANYSWHSGCYTREYDCVSFTLGQWKLTDYIKLPFCGLNTTDELISIIQKKSSFLYNFYEEWCPYHCRGRKEAMYLTLTEPYIETLVKAGFTFPNQVLDGTGRFKETELTLMHRLCQSGSNPKVIFKTDKAVYSVLKDTNDLKVWDLYRRMYKTGKINQALVQDLYRSQVDTKELEQMSSILGKQYNGKPLFTWSSLMNYLDRLDQFEAISRREALPLLRDYLEMCRQLEVKPRTDGDSLKREHDIMARNCREKRNEIMAREMQTACTDMAKYNYEEGVFLVRAVKDYDDLLDEAKQQHNCVASYAKRIADGQSLIFFLREVRKPDTSVVTIEVNPRGEIVQKFMAYNQPIRNRAITEFIERWNKVLRERMVQAKKLKKAV